jgi:hypothetical protein
MKMVNITMENGSKVSLFTFIKMFIKRFIICVFAFVFQKGKRHGRGEYFYIDSSKYLGNWENDRINGEGTSWYPNGNK